MADFCCTSRRTLLRAAGVGLGAVALSACGGGDDGVRTVTTDGAEGTDGGTALVDLADLPVGSTTELEVEGRRLLLARPEEGTVLAYDAECPHQGCNVRATDGGLACPCHSSVFDPATGEPTEGPAEEPLTPVEVTVEGDRVLLA